MLRNLLLSCSLLFALLPAFASESATKSNPLLQIIPLVLIFLVFYFFIIRPQSKKVKDQINLLKSLKLEDRVVTNSGIYGVIKKIDDKKGLVSLEVAKNVRISVSKVSISSVIEKDIDLGADAS